MGWFCKQEVAGLALHGGVALNSGGDRRSREAGWRWKKKDQFVISEISGT